MPTGAIVDALSVLIGGLLGAFGGHLLSDEFKRDLNLIFGICSMGMGVMAIAPMKNMPAVIFALILGTVIGLACHLGQLFNKGAMLMQAPISKHFPAEKLGLTHDEFVNQLVTSIVLFCASGTGIYGSLTAGMTGDNSILFSKAILDLFTAAIFACNLGYVVSLVAIPQFLVLFLLFILAQFILPMTNNTMIIDFKACGGFLMLATGFRMAKLKNFPIADMIPAMILVMPFSWFWVNVVLKALGA
ncbi:membrane protein [Lactobacillus nasalidis]|uniref:Membrane protein n=1 Tax=Lactobacillus nasalidis TaxID=2797258 RepID=A0ABQ3WA48_9LACO|nr:DUF554 domain-containing protein [Lactobacillus nasalidis]GHV96860.1 membrane protein [Lactobacillus nasalidis]GHV98961.1 membrane protein [Lactobacillus nasalidis]GHW01057.1 membrane protein [Lactobacillus nasalidis]